MAAIATTMTMDWLNSIWTSVDRLSSVITKANWGIAVTLLVTFAFTAVAIVATSRRDRLLKKEDLEREAKIASAHVRAAGLEVAAEQLRQDNLRMSARVHELNIEADKERAARLMLEQRVAPRSIGEDQRTRLVAALGRGRGSTVSIRAPNSSAESSRFAGQIRDVFLASGWQAEPVAHAIIGIVGGPPPVEPGIVMFVQNQTSELGILIQRAFKDVDIDVKGAIDSRMAPAAVIIVVGQKPPQ